MIVVAIDMGLSTFASLTCSNGNTPWLIKGNILKSINTYYNEQHRLAVQNSDKKRMKRLDQNRNRKVRRFFLSAIQVIIKYCEINNADVVALGKYVGTEIEEKDFISLSYESFYLELLEKLKNKEILVKLVDEKYTSGTSFLERETPELKNYDKSRRYKGLFYSKSGVMNANVNDSYQIMVKAFPESISKRKEYKIKPKIIKLDVR